MSKVLVYVGLSNTKSENTMIYVYIYIGMAFAFCLGMIFGAVLGNVSANNEVERRVKAARNVQ